VLFETIAVIPCCHGLRLTIVNYNLKAPFCVFHKLLGDHFFWAFENFVLEIELCRGFRLLFNHRGLEWELLWVVGRFEFD
jgi:hypothetical protein